MAFHYDFLIPTKIYMSDEGKRAGKRGIVTANIQNKAPLP